MSDFFRLVLTQPLFNLLIIIYALIPGNDFGVALIIFTVIVRLLLWPLMKKQLHHQKAMRELQPEVAKIRKKAGNDRNKAAQMTMELYKEREINPLASLGVVFLQLPILLALFFMLSSVLNDHATVERLSYSVTSSLEPVKEIIASPDAFHPELFGIVDLSKHAVDNSNGLAVYWAGVPFVLLAGLGQFIQTRQITSSREQRKGLRQLLKDAKDGKEVSDEEQQAAMTSSMTYMFPILTVVVGMSFPIALSLYWAVSSFVAIIQQRMILEQDVKEMVAVEEEPKPAKPKKKKKKGKR